MTQYNTITIKKEAVIELLLDIVCKEFHISRALVHGYHLRYSDEFTVEFGNFGGKKNTTDVKPEEKEEI